jgi:tetratricopeptide (TPR) repeat protein
VPLNRALARDPKCVRALELRAAIALAENRPADAEAALAAALAAALEAAPGERPRLLLRLAKARLGSGRAAEALEAAQEAAAASPTAEAIEIIAVSAQAAGATPVALGAADQLVAMTTDPAPAARYARLAGEIHRRAGDTAGASALYRRALQLAPDDEEALAGLEGTHLDAKDVAGLAAAWEALAATDPLRAQAYRMRAAQAWSSGDPAKAAEALQAAVQEDPTNGALRLALARSYAAVQGTWPKAAGELRALVAQSPLLAEPYRELLALFDRSGRRDASFCALAALVALREASAAEAGRYAELASALKPAGAALAPEDVELLVHPIERSSPVREVLAALSPALLKVIPGNLEAHGLTRNDRMKGDLKAAADHYAKVFGTAEVELLQSARTPAAAWVENTEPPTLVLGAARASAPLGEGLFTVGLLLGRVRQRNQAAFFAQPVEVANLVAEALRQVDPAFARFGTRNDALGAALGRVLARGERKLVEATLPRFATAQLNFGAVTTAMALTSHRFGLATSGDPAAALAALTDHASPATLGARTDVKELLSFAVSEEHLAVRQKLRTAIA